MNSLTRGGWCLWLAVGCGAWAAAQSPSLPAPPPQPASPVAFFRQLLATNAEARTRILEGRSERQRTAIEAKLREYEALPAAERDLRLRATELRWYLRPLLTVGGTNDQAPILLAQVPAEYRGLVEERIRVWAALPEATRRDLLQHENALNWNRTAAGRPPAESQGRSRGLERELGEWQALPPERRARLVEDFERFFELSDRQRERTLATFSAEDRQRMQATLHAFELLPPAQRRLCLNSFTRFAGMSPAERNEFLRSVDRWREMSPQERDQWRQLVANLPPLPPMGGGLTPPLPPVSPRPPVLATNR